MNDKAPPSARSITGQRLSITYQQVSNLHPDPRNPRLHSAKQIRQIAESIRVFGFLVPVLLNEKGQLVAGHGRVLAAQQLGMGDVPTIVVDHLTPEQARAFGVAGVKLRKCA